MLALTKKERAHLISGDEHLLGLAASSDPESSPRDQGSELPRIACTKTSTVVSLGASMTASLNVRESGYLTPRSLGTNRRD
jgi:hypothetical protein